MAMILVMAGLFYANNLDAKSPNSVRLTRATHTYRTAPKVTNNTTPKKTPKANIPDSDAPDETDKSTANESSGKAPAVSSSTPPDPEPVRTITNAPTTEVAVVVPASKPEVNVAMPKKAPRANIPARATAYQKDSLELGRYPYINATYDDTPHPPSTIDDFCHNAGVVIFKVNKTNIEPGNPFLNELRSEILPLIQSQHLELYRIDVRGAASPEGNIQNNARLARERANILRDSITSILPSAKGDIINLGSEQEDYELLIYYMREAGDPDTELVESLYNKWKNRPADLKWALYTAKNRTLWKRLLAEYFPRLRATRVILYFHISPDAPPQPPVVEEEPEDTIPVVEEPPFECHCNGMSVCQCAQSGKSCQCKRPEKAHNAACRHCNGDAVCRCNDNATGAPLNCNGICPVCDKLREHDGDFDCHNLCDYCDKLRAKQSGSCRCTENGDPCRCNADEAPCTCGHPESACHCGNDEPEGYCPCITPPMPEPQDTIVHRRPVWAIGTNLIYDLWYMPDYGFAPMWNGKLEYYPHSNKHNFWNHTSFCAGFINPYWHSWKRHKFFQIRNYELEARLYHRYDEATEQRYGWYIGAAADVNKFGIGLSDLRGWQGEGFGFQVSGGYVLPLNKCKSWKLEFNLGAGFYQTKYDPYIYEDPYANSDLGHGEYNPPTYNPTEEEKLHYYYKWYGSSKDFKKRQYRYRWLGPTQIGISIKYDFLWKRKQRRGVSFKHHETWKEVQNE